MEKIIPSKSYMTYMSPDKSNLREVTLNFPKQLEADLEFLNQLNISRRKFNKVIICGMGGSSQVGDLLVYFKNADYAPLNLKLSVFTHRSYDLPPDTDENTLIICISYSGGTEETISSYEKAREHGIEIVGIACAGPVLGDLFQQNKTPWIKISNDKIPPRSSLGYQLAALVKIFVAYGLLPQGAQNALAKAARQIKPAELEDNAKLLSEKLFNKIPVIYSSENNKALARIWKIKFNENTKIPAFWNNLPELNHNEMQGWEKNLAPFHIIFLQDDADLPRIQKRMGVTARLLKGKDIPCDFVKISGSDALEKLIYALVFGDWLSYHLAMAYGVDPTPVAMIEDFKKALIEG